MQETSYLPGKITAHILLRCSKKRFEERLPWRVVRPYPGPDFRGRSGKYLGVPGPYAHPGLCPGGTGTPGALRPRRPRASVRVVVEDGRARRGLAGDAVPWDGPPVCGHSGPPAGFRGLEQVSAGAALGGGSVPQAYDGDIRVGPGRAGRESSIPEEAPFSEWGTRGWGPGGREERVGELGPHAGGPVRKGDAGRTAGERLVNPRRSLLWLGGTDSLREGNPIPWPASIWDVPREGRPRSSYPRVATRAGEILYLPEEAVEPLYRFLLGRGRRLERGVSRPDSIIALRSGRFPRRKYEVRHPASRACRW